MTTSEQIRIRADLASLPDSALLNTNEAAMYLCCRPQTLAKNRCIGQGDIPYLKIGARVVYRKSDLDASLSQYGAKG